jgi:hypothetical protein
MIQIDFGLFFTNGHVHFDEAQNMYFLTNQID